MTFSQVNYDMRIRDFVEMFESTTCQGNMITDNSFQRSRIIEILWNANFQISFNAANSG